MHAGGMGPLAAGVTRGDGDVGARPHPAGAVEDAGYTPGEVETLPAEPALARATGGDSDYDLVAIGAGSAAFAAAIRATNLGARVAIVERNTIGGTCVNVGCIPSKHLLAAADAHHQAGHHPFAASPPPSTAWTSPR
jgi:mercuric reductase